MLKRWWIGIPAKLRRGSPSLSGIWSDGIYLTMWPSLAVALPLLMLLLGVAEGATHWDFQGLVLVPPAVVFAQIIPFTAVVVAVGCISGNLGLMLVLGYALGDFALAGPVLAPGHGDFLWRFLHLRLPQLYSYFLLYLLAVQPLQNGKALLPLRERIFRAGEPLALLGGFLVMAGAVLVTVWGWTLAAPMLFRVSWIWGGNYVPPVTVPDYARLTSALLIKAAAAGLVLRFGLALWSGKSRSAALHAGLLTLAVQRADQYYPWSLPRGSKTLLRAGLVTLMLLGFLSTPAAAALVFSIAAVLLCLHGTLLPKFAFWRRWTALLQRCPAWLRWCAALGLAFLAGRGILALPEQSATVVVATGAFGQMIAGFLVSLAVALALFPVAAAKSDPRQ